MCNHSVERLRTYNMKDQQQSKRDKQYEYKQERITNNEFNMSSQVSSKSLCNQL